jgi:8-oxo-dGTP diphosphatase
VLAAKRAENRGYPGQWEFPGGKLEAGETPLQAAVREIREELAVDVDNPREVGRSVHHYPEFTVELVFVRADWNGKGKLVQTEHPEVRWCLPRELSALDFLAADRPFVERVAREGLPG